MTRRSLTGRGGGRLREYVSRMNSADPGFALLAFTSMLAIVNPLGAVPVYAALTGDFTRERRLATLRVAIITANTALFAFAIGGPWILRIFGVTADAFRITGGVLMLGIGYDMVRAKRGPARITKAEEDEAGHRDEVGVIPLGIPSLAGPGAITTVITLMAEAGSMTHRAVVLATIPMVMLVAWFVLRVAPAVLLRVGQTGVNVLTRLMGLLVMVIGMQFVITGIESVAAG